MTTQYKSTHGESSVVVERCEIVSEDDGSEKERLALGMQVRARLFGYSIGGG